MAYSILQHKMVKGVAVGSGGLGVAFASNLTAGSLLIVIAGGWAQTWVAGNCTDSKSQSYTFPANGHATGTNVGIGLWYFPNSGSGACTVTVKPPTASNDMDVWILEVANMDTTSGVFDQAATSINNTASGTYADGTTAATTNATDLIIFAATSNGNNSVPTAPSGATLDDHIETTANVPMMGADKRVTSTGTQTGSFTGCDIFPSVGVIAAFKEASGGGDPFPAGYQAPTPGGQNAVYRM